MNYTIATMRETHRDARLEYVKDGNKFVVYYQNSGNGEHASRRFDTAAQAAEVFQKITGWMLLGLYADKDRCSYLETGTMD